MHCVRCGKPLIKAAKTIPAKHGPLMWGPVCALKAGLIEPPARQRVMVVHQEAQGVDESQMTLELAA